MRRVGFRVHSVLTCQPANALAVWVGVCHDFSGFWTTHHSGDQRTSLTKANPLRMRNTKTKLPNGLRPWRAQEPPLSSALRLCRPGKVRPPFGKEIRLLHLPPPLAWARAKACLKTNTAKPLKDKGTCRKID
jgi:hypothetical protein